MEASTTSFGSATSEFTEGARTAACSRRCDRGGDRISAETSQQTKKHSPCGVSAVVTGGHVDNSVIPPGSWRGRGNIRERSRRRSGSRRIVEEVRRQRRPYGGVGFFSKHGGASRIDGGVTVGRFTA